MLVYQSGAVEPVKEQLDLQQFILEQLQTDNSIKISIIFLL